MALSVSLLNVRHASSQEIIMRLIKCSEPFISGKERLKN